MAKGKITCHSRRLLRLPVVQLRAGMECWSNAAAHLIGAQLRHPWQPESLNRPGLLCVSGGLFCPAPRCRQYCYLETKMVSIYFLFPGCLCIHIFIKLPQRATGHNLNLLCLKGTFLSYVLCHQQMSLNNLIRVHVVGKKKEFVWYIISGLLMIWILPLAETENNKNGWHLTTLFQ